MKRTTASRTKRLAQTVIVVLVALSTFFVSRILQPRFEGKTLGQWISSLPLMVDAAGNQFFDDSELLKLVAQAGPGIRTLAPHALSRLERELRAPDSVLGLARYQLELRWANTLRRDPSYVPAAYRRARAMSALSELGAIGTPYLTELRIASTNAAEPVIVRAHARWALEKLAPHTIPPAEHRDCIVNYEWCGLDPVGPFLQVHTAILRPFPTSMIDTLQTKAQPRPGN